MPKMREEVKQVVKPKGGNGMREILFRGKRIGNSEWVYGYYVPVCFGRFPCKPAIVPESDGTWEPIEIKKETVGQFTGLPDKNGKKIFEGDIISCGYLCNFFVEYSEEDAEYWANFGDSIGSLHTYFDPKRATVIGNIYDNPELLEVKE